MESFYDAPDIHLLMLRDDIRNSAFRDAIRETVKPGDVVLDFGAGTGILSMFAAQAEAAHVFAVERTGIANLAGQIVAKNGLADRITVLRGEMEHIRLPQKVDVIVSEWLGTYGIDENMLAPLLLARDRWLKPEGKMLPERVTAWICPIWNSDLEIDMNLGQGRPYDLDLSLVVDGTARKMTWARQPLTIDDLMAEPQSMWTTDVYACSLEQARLPFRALLGFVARRTGKINALTAWFSADFGAGVRLTNSPAAPRTHWAQYIFPLEQTVEITKGTPIAIEFTCIPIVPGSCAHAWSVRISSNPWEHHDTRGTAWQA